MPILLNTDEIQPGSCLAAPFIYHGRMMLPAQRPLSVSQLEVLRRQYGGIELHVLDPVLDQAAQFEDDTYEKQIALQVHKAIKPGIDYLLERVAQLKHKSLPSGDLAPIRKIVQQQIELLYNQPVSLALTSSVTEADRYLSCHTANVFYLSLVLGLTMRDYVASERLRLTSSRGVHRSTALDLLPLGLGVACMDLAMLPLEHLAYQKEPLTQEQKHQIRQHPAVSADMLPDSFSPTARSIVRTHHENFDGQGYPHGLAGDKLHVFTRITRIADAFDAATSTHAYRCGRSQARVLWEMTFGPMSRFYDPLLMQVFFGLIQPFPIGARLELTDGRWAVIVSYNRTNPFEPCVIVGFDAQGQRLPTDQLQGPVEVNEASGLRLASYRGEDLSYIYDGIVDDATHDTTGDTTDEATDERVEELAATSCLSGLLEAAYP